LDPRQVKGCSRIVHNMTEPSDDLAGTGVDASHLAHLMVSFANIDLVDTYSVDLYQSTFVSSFARNP
jgi:hypothetical protein